MKWVGLVRGSQREGSQTKGGRRWCARAANLGDERTMAIVTTDVFQYSELDEERRQQQRRGR